MKILVLLYLMILSNPSFSQQEIGKEAKSVGRRIVSMIDATVIKSETDCNICFWLYIDEQGVVTSKPMLVNSRTTCLDSNLIDDIANLIYKGLRYEAGIKERRMLSIKIDGDPNI